MHAMKENYRMLCDLLRQHQIRSSIEVTEHFP